jgi:hypothetical protein
MTTEFALQERERERERRLRNHSKAVGAWLEKEIELA